MEKTNQREKILRHMNAFGSITAAEAMQEYGIMRLSARIFELKEHGYAIDKKMRSAKNRFGETVSFAEYRWMYDEQQTKRSESGESLGEKTA